MILEAIRKNGLFLAVFAALTTGVIAGTNLLTKDRIAEQIRAAKERALLQIVPRERHDNNMLDSSVTLPDADKLNIDEGSQGFLARKDGKTVAIILPTTAPDGYSGDIDVLVGINIDGSVAGVRVVQHEETPGLGDKVDIKKSDWILSFNGKSLKAPLPELWAVKKDKGVFDQFTGATITPRAVTGAVYRSLRYIEDRPQLLEQKDGE
jgi:electron transport complex protein RnfG